MVSVMFDDNVILASLEVGQWENIWPLSTYDTPFLSTYVASTHGVSDKRQKDFVRNHFRIITIGNSDMNCYPKVLQNSVVVNRTPTQG